MEPTFKRARWVGTLAERQGERAAAQKSYWKSFKRPLVYEQSGPCEDLSFLPTDHSQLLIAASIRVSLRSKGHVGYEEERSVCKMNDTVRAVACRTDGRLVAAAGASGDILILDVATRTLLRTLTGHKAPVSNVKFLADKAHIVSVSDDKTVRLWDIASGAEVWAANAHCDFVRACAVASVPESKIFVTGSYDHSVIVWSRDSSVPLMTMDHGSPVEAVALLADGVTAVSAGSSTLKFWDISDGGRFAREMVVHHKTISSLSVSSDGRYLFTGSLDRSMKIVSLGDFTVAHQFKFPAAVMSISISSNLRRVAAGLSSGRAVILSFLGGKEPAAPKTASSQKAAAQLPSMAVESHVVLKEQRAPLKQFDRLLKSFKYRDALDSVIRSRSGALLSSAIGELIRRDGLVAALSGRTEAELIPLLEMILQSIGNPRFSSLAMEAAFAILDIYSEVAGKSGEFDSCIKRLRTAVNQQIEIQQGLMRLGGALRLLTSGRAMAVPNKNS